MICDGCKKEIANNQTVKIDWLVPDKIYILHKNCSNRYNFPKKKCLNLLKADLDLCVGCGKKHNSDRLLCIDCKTILERQATINAPKLQWYCIDTYGVSENEHRSDDNENDKLASILVNAISRDGRIGHAGDAWNGDFGGVISSRGKRGRHDTHTGMPAVELTEEQADAAQKLLNWITTNMKSQLQSGIKKGHNVLVRLASGEISSKEYDDIKERQLYTEK